MDVSIRAGSPPPLPEEGASLAEVLAEIAETAAETLELQDVFDRVAEAIRRLIPFDNMGVVRIVGGDRAVLHATTVPCAQHQAECFEPEPLDSWSARLRPRPGPIPRVQDAARELDATYPVDGMLLSKGVASSMWEPFRMAGSFYGGVWLSSFRAAAFTDQHQEKIGRAHV